MTELMEANAEQLSQQQEARVLAVDFPERRLRLFVREISGEDFDTLRKAWSAKGSESFSLIVCKAACDSTGKRLFGDKELAKVNALPVAVLKKLAEAAFKFNELTADQGELEGN